MQAQAASAPNRLAELRQASGLIRSEVAAAVRVDQSTLYRWETGKSEVPDAAKALLADLFKVTRSYLMGWDDELAA